VYWKLTTNDLIMNYELTMNGVWMDYKFMDKNLCKWAPFIMWSYCMLAFVTSLPLLMVDSLQQKVSLYVKWFHWILSEFIGCSERGLVKK
jgi:uncharacterized membrane protein